MCRRLTAVGTLRADLWTGPQDLRPGRHRGADLWRGAALLPRGGCGARSAICL